jgi:glycosyltransferase involved in cell wall biosynthesis
MTTVPELSVVIPACNEQDRLGPTLDAYLAALAQARPGAWELWVVVNGSTDGTEALVRARQPQHPSLRLEVIPERVGKGGALIRGLRLARGQVVGYVDADGATAPEEFLRLCSLLPGQGAVIGSRWIPGARVSRRQSWARRLSSRLFNLAVRLLFGLRLRDTQCGAKAISRPALDAVASTLGVTHWVFDVDLLYQIHRAGFAIREEPTEWNDVEGSKVRVWRSLPDVLYALLRLRLLFSPLRPLVARWDRLVGDRAFRRQLRAGRLSTRPPGRDGRAAP